MLRSLTHTHLHLEKGTAERGPAEQRLQEGQLRLVGGHTALFVVGGEDALKKKIAKRQAYTF